MIPWLLAVLALFVVQTILPSLRYLTAGRGVRERLRIALGPRDLQPPFSVLDGRAQRALANLHEALPVFLALALLHASAGADPVAELGAAGFFVARLLYVPAYLSGIMGLRSALWVASWCGLGVMIARLP